MKQAHRFSGPGKPYEGLTKLVKGKGPQWTGEVRCIPEMLEKPLRWRKPRRIFVNSMSDLFHPEVPFDFVDSVFAVMAACPQHTFLVLTKRPERMCAYFEGEGRDPRPPMADGASVMFTDVAIKAGAYGAETMSFFPLPNVHLGTSVENQATADERIPHLLNTPAAVRWLSVEPLLSSVDLRFAYDPEECIRLPFPCHGGVGPTNELHWIVVGGESGPRARPMDPNWVRSIRDQCQEAGVPFFFKQWGEWLSAGECLRQDIIEQGRNYQHHRWGDVFSYRVGKKAAGRELGGRTWDEYPEPTP